MPVLTVTSRKGGCGKTTLCTALAAEGENVALLDAHPNATVYRWASTLHEGKPIRAYAEADAERLAELLPQLAEQHRVLLIGTAASAIRRRVAAAGTDAVLVPATPGERDVTEVQRTVAFVEGSAAAHVGQSPSAWWRTASAAAPPSPDTCSRSSNASGFPASKPA